jgi:hypothetical protein
MKYREPRWNVLAVNARGVRPVSRGGREPWVAAERGDQDARRRDDELDHVHEKSDRESASGSVAEADLAGERPVRSVDDPHLVR